jgi:hypothetical protein
MKIFKSSLIILTIAVLNSCTNANNSEENLRKLDKIYGYCDNPHRNIPPKQYEACIAKQDAAGPDGEIGESKSFNDILDQFNNRGESKINYVKSVNSNLWQGAMDVLSPYSLKLIDSEIGYIETDWIYEKKSPDRRCIVKVQITSIELTSTSVKSSLTCQVKDGDSWFVDEQDYFDQEKKLTLAILSKGAEYSSQNF